MCAAAHNAPRTAAVGWRTSCCKLIIVATTTAAAGAEPAAGNRLSVQSPWSYPTIHGVLFGVGTKTMKETIPTEVPSSWSVGE